MTLKYESELIKDIVDTRGHEKSSLHYESECIGAWIEETKGAYPKLCDYESEWLNYINGNEIGKFPYETVTANPTATVNNVVPYSYKSAILKGQTLVNLSKFESNIEKTSTGASQTISSNDVTMLKTSSTYTFIYWIESTSGTTVSNITTLDGSDTQMFDRKILQSSGNLESNFILKFSQTSRDFTGHYGLKFSALNGSVKLVKSVILEGDYTNVDIPYFEGMQSVKLPVLTTTGKNLFDGDFYFRQKYGINIKTIVGADNRTSASTVINVRPNTEYYIKSFNQLNGKLRFKGVMFYDANGDYLSETLGYGYAGSFVTPSNCHYITFEVQTSDWSEYTLDELKSQNYQIEEGSIATSFESYKSNILTVNEPIELRGIGEGSNRVEDELDCLTGELTQRIGEVFSNSLRASGALSIGTYANVIPVNYPVNFLGWENRNLICDKLKIINRADINWDKTSSINGISLQGAGFWFVVDKTITTQEQANEYINNLNATIQYQLATESVKTVDLTVANQDNESLNKIKPIEGTMNINVSGNPINPIGVFEVPVEAIVQNLGSFIEEEK